MQTEAYPHSARQALALSESIYIDIVLLTPDRTPGRNSDAVAASYLELAIALAEGAGASQLDQQTQFAYSLIITHLAVNALPQAINVRQLASSADEWSKPIVGVQRMRSQLRDVLAFRKLLRMEFSHE